MALLSVCCNSTHTDKEKANEHDSQVPIASVGVGNRRGRNGRSEIDANDPARTARKHSPGRPVSRNPCGHCRNPGRRTRRLWACQSGTGSGEVSSGWGGVSPHRCLRLGEERQILRRRQGVRETNRRAFPAMARGGDHLLRHLDLTLQGADRGARWSGACRGYHTLGTNDCRGWIRRSLFEKLDLPARHFYQFRLAFNRTQAKGSFKVMENDAAEQIGADIILPKSSMKPALPEKSAIVKLCFGDAQLFRGPVVLGIREISRTLEYESSYTLLTHAPEDSIDLEVLPHALEQVRKLKTTVDENNFEELFRLLGTSNTSRPVHGIEDLTEDSEYTSAERTVVEAALKADGSGQLVKFPFINNQLQRILCRWAYKLCTAGGFRLHAFALADAGY